MPDETEHPGVYLNEGEPGKTVEGVPTSAPLQESTYPGVYVDEGDPAKPIGGVPTTGSGNRSRWRRWRKPFVLVGAAAGLGAYATRRRPR